MEDALTLKVLRPNEKIHFVLETMMYLAKEGKLSTTFQLALVSSHQSIDHFALFAINKKSKKLECVIPITAECKLLDLDRLNFILYWDPQNYD